MAETQKALTIGDVLGGAAKAGKIAIEAIVGLASELNKAVEGIANLAKASKLIGVNAKALEELRLAAALAGVEQDSLDTALKTFVGNITEAASSSGDARTAFTDLGIRVRALKEESVVALFGEVAEGLSRIGNEAERDKLLLKLFGNEGRLVSSIMEGGAAGFKAYVQDARQINVFDKKLIPLMLEFRKVQATVLAGFRDIGDGILIGLLPGLIELGKVFANFFIENKDGIKAFISNVGQLVSSTFKAFKAILTALGLIWDVFAPVLRPILGIAATIVAALIALSQPWLLLIVLIDLLVSKLEGGESVLERLIEAFNQFVSDLVTAITTAVMFWQQVFSSFFNWIAGLITTAVAFWQEAVGVFINLIMGLVATAVTFWQQAIVGFFSWISEFFVSVKEFWSGLFQNLFGIITEFWTGDLFAFFDNLIAKATSIGDTIKGLFSGLFGGDGTPQVATTAKALTSIGQTGVLAPGSTLATATARPGIVNAPKNDVSVAVQAGPGMNEQQLAVEVARKIEEALQRQNRNAFEALMPAMATG